MLFVELWANKVAQGAGATSLLLAIWFVLAEVVL